MKRKSLTTHKVTRRTYTHMLTSCVRLSYATSDSSICLDLHACLDYIADLHSLHLVYFFFFNDTATTEIYTLSLHDSLFFFLNDPAPPDLSPFPLHGPLPI